MNAPFGIFEQSRAEPWKSEIVGVFDRMVDAEIEAARLRRKGDSRFDYFVEGTDA